MTRLRLVLPILLALAAASAAAAPPNAAALKSLAAQYAPVDIKVDLGKLGDGDRRALAKLIEAAQVIDGIYLRQAWAGNDSLLLRLAADHSPDGQARLKYFLIQKGPWDRQNANAAFLPGVPEKPAQANFYPASTTKAEVDRWLTSLGDKDKAGATGFYSVIRKTPDGRFVYLPYSVEYQNELERAAGLLDEAAALSPDATLKKFLSARAKAFRSNDYYESDVAWMQLDSAIEPTIGPYETYEDEWFGNKASFEAFIGVRDDAETAKLARFGAELQGLEDALPIDAKLRNPKLGALAPIRVVNQVFTAGDADHDVKTAAYNLPNDERVTREYGAKRIMLKNVQEAKFKLILMPIARAALAPADQKLVDFDAFFTSVLMHELMHGLGPHDIVVGGKKTTARQALEETASAIEEAKADVAGMWAMQRLIDKGTLPRTMEQTMYTTYLAGTFRTLRFGTTEAHGKGMAVQLNYLVDHGAVKIGKDGVFTVDAAKMKEGIAGLTHDLLMLEATGDHAAAKQLLDTQGVIRPEVARMFERLRGVPVDIDPVPVTARELLAR